MLREEDGSCRFAGVKWGDWELFSDESLTEVVTSVRRDGTLVDTVEAGSFGSWYCQGVAIDLSARVFRCHPCWAKGRHLESLDQRMDYRLDHITYGATDALVPRARPAEPAL